VSEPYEQMELDTRPKLQVAIEDLSAKAVSDAGELIQEHYRQVAVENMVAPPLVRNRHEAYGIAAEQLVKINAAVKAIKSDTDRLLGTLADPNFNAVDATSSIVNSITDATGVLIRAAAEMKRTLDDLYTAEMNASPGKTPMEALADGDGFQEAEDLAPEDPDLDPDTDPDAEPGDNETEE